MPEKEIILAREGYKAALIKGDLKEMEKHASTLKFDNAMFTIAIASSYVTPKIPQAMPHVHLEGPTYFSYSLLKETLSHKQWHTAQRALQDGFLEWRGAQDLLAVGASLLQLMETPADEKISTMTKHLTELFIKQVPNHLDYEKTLPLITAVYQKTAYAASKELGKWVEQRLEHTLLQSYAVQVKLLAGKKDRSLRAHIKEDTKAAAEEAKDTLALFKPAVPLSGVTGDLMVFPEGVVRREEPLAADPLIERKVSDVKKAMERFYGEQKEQALLWEQKVAKVKAVMDAERGGMDGR